MEGTTLLGFMAFVFMAPPLLISLAVAILTSMKKDD